MEGRGLASRTELLELKTVRIVSTILLGDVIPFLTVHTGHGDLGTNVRTLTCHGLAPFYPYP
jgi:hypothetical protein